MATYCDCEKIFSSEDFKKNAYLKFREMPVRLASQLRLLTGDIFTVKDVVFKVNGLGNIVTGIELNQLEGEYISPSVFQVVKMNPSGDLGSNGPNKLQELIAENNELRTRNAYLESLLRNSLDVNID